MSLETFEVLDSGTPTNYLMLQLQTRIAAHAAWEFVERVTGSATGNFTDVYKCLGTVNSYGTDFFIGIQRVAEPGAITVCMGETYDSGTKKFGNPAVWTGSSNAYSTPVGNAYSTARHVANETTMAASTTGFLHSTATISTTATPASGNAVGAGAIVWLSITNDRIVMSWNSYCIYAGLYDRLYDSSTDPFPIVVGNPHIHTEAMGTGLVSTFQTRPQMAYTREIGSTGTVLSLAFSGSVDGPILSVLPNALINTQKDPISGQSQFSRLRITSNARRCVQRGLLKGDVMYLRSGGTSEGIGDTCTVDGTAYTCIYVDHPEVTGYSNFNGSYWVATAA